METRNIMLACHIRTSKLESITFINELKARYGWRQGTGGGGVIRSENEERCLHQCPMPEDGCAEKQERLTDCYGSMTATDWHL
jgi:hypothetical protein